MMTIAVILWTGYVTLVVILGAWTAWTIRGQRKIPLGARPHLAQTRRQRRAAARQLAARPAHVRRADPVRVAALERWHAVADDQGVEAADRAAATTIRSVVTHVEVDACEPWERCDICRVAVSSLTDGLCVRCATYVANYTAQPVRFGHFGL